MASDPRTLCAQWADSRTKCEDGPPKYKCAGCLRQLCSLPCYKRHQVRTLCTGHRNPAAYKPKAVLATPAGIDQDFNFLTSIERTLGRAGEDLQQQLQSQGQGRRDPGPGSNLWKGVEEIGVVVKKAPKGMSRERTNNTRYSTKAKCVIWSLEWLLEDGTREMSEARTTSTLGKAFEDMLKTKANAQAAGVKRRREDGENGAQKRRRSEPDISAIEKPEAPTAASLKEDVQADATTETPTTASQAEASQNTPPPTAEPSTSQPPEPCPSVSAENQPTRPQQHIYLHHPSLPHPSRVLIPLSPNTTISASLRNRVILEFPTYIVLFHPPDALPAGYVTEEEFYRQCRKEAGEFPHVEELIKEEGDDVVGGRGGQGQGEGEVDVGWEDSKVLEVLRKDVAAR